mmetsp:Transcript_9495/g.20576  ORF Transcript_9495/g.20576 Transcript_9495/m.20576 type:complete len:224 (-) Transcript_9495:315-986(-)
MSSCRVLPIRTTRHGVRGRPSWKKTKSCLSILRLTYRSHLICRRSCHFHLTCHRNYHMKSCWRRTSHRGVPILRRVPILRSVLRSVLRGVLRGHVLRGHVHRSHVHRVSDHRSWMMTNCILPQTCRIHQTCLRSYRSCRPWSCYLSSFRTTLQDQCVLQPKLDDPNWTKKMSWSILRRSFHIRRSCLPCFQTCQTCCLRSCCWKTKGTPNGQCNECDNRPVSC